MEKKITTKNFNKKLFYFSIAVVMLAGTSLLGSDNNREDNPFMHKFDTPFGVPPFNNIKLTDYLPAFKAGIEQQNQEIKKIIDIKANPNFNNTIEQLEESGEILNRTSSVFFNLLSVQNNKQIRDIAKEASPILSKHEDNIKLNKKLFTKIKFVYDKQEKESLNDEQKEVLRQYYTDFVRAGANLSEEKQDELRKINPELAVLYLKFGENVINEINSYKMYVTNKADLAGLPDSVIASAVSAAEKDGHKGEWLFTIQKPSMFPFLQYANNRALREKLMTAYHNISNNNNENDNKDIIKQIVSLRTKKAHLLGYKNFAEYAIEDNMAKTVKAAYNMTMKVYKPALKQAKIEAKELQDMIYKSGEKFKLESWDWSYYAEKIRKEKYDIDESKLSQYFVLDNVVQKGLFFCANKLYGISFKELDNIPKPHPDAKAYEVIDKNKEVIGILYQDFFSRSSKRAGAWMSSYRKQSNLNKKIIPIITMVCNFSEPTKKTPALLTPDQVQTAFHEFGHSLHGLLSNCTYEKVSGTDVPKDYVELPSQFMENWAFQPSVLNNYAFNYKTDKVIPATDVKKLKEAATFNQGFISTEVLSGALLDFAYHTRSEEKPIDNIKVFEKNAMNDIGLIPEIHVRYGSTYFNHIFSSEGYASGYYVYNWAEVLSADAFEGFTETGDIYNPEKAALFKEWVLEKGGSGDVMKFYKNFRGKKPTPDALLKSKGLKE